MLIEELKTKIKIDEYRMRMMFICENLDMFYNKRILSMEKDREPWKTISKWIVENEGFPKHEFNQQRFSIHVFKMTPEELATHCDLVNGSIERFEWYKRWSFETHSLLKSDPKFFQPPKSLATMSVGNMDSNESVELSTFDSVSALLGDNSSDSSSPSLLTSLDEETEEFLRFPPSCQQTLDCDWYMKLVNKKRRLMEKETQDLSRSSSSNGGITVFKNCCGFSFALNVI